MISPNAITTKAEIDVMQAADLDQAAQLAVANTAGALVVHPTLLERAFAFRKRWKGRYPIYTLIDYPKGDLRGENKFRNLTLSMIDADGYEVTLSDAKNEEEATGEAVRILEFVKQRLNRKPVRFVLGTITKSASVIATLCRGLAHINSEFSIRTDQSTKAQPSKASLAVHSKVIAAVKQHLQKRAIKVSGNMDSLATISGCIDAGASIVATSVQQYRHLIVQLSQTPDQRMEPEQEHEPEEAATQ